MAFIMVPDGHTYAEGVRFNAYVGGGSMAEVIFSDGSATVTLDVDLG